MTWSRGDRRYLICVVFSFQLMFVFVEYRSQNFKGNRQIALMLRREEALAHRCMIINQWKLASSSGATASSNFGTIEHLSSADDGCVHWTCPPTPWLHRKIDRSKIWAWRPDDIQAHCMSESAISVLCLEALHR